MKDKKIEICAWTLFIISCIYTVIFCFINVAPAKLGMTSDTANIGICAKIFWESGSLSPVNFIPYTDSGIFSLSVLGAPIYGLTGNLWYAQCIPLVVVTFMILLSVIYMLRSEGGITKFDIAFMLVMVLAFPPGWYQQYTTFLFLAAYSLCIISLFWLLGDFFRLIKGTLKHKRLHFMLQLIFAFFHGLNSSRGVLVVYTPFVLLVAFRYLIQMLNQKHIWIKKEIMHLIGALSLFAVSYFSTWLPCSVRTTGNIDLSGIFERFAYQILPAIRNELGLNSNTNLFMMVIIIFFTLLSCIVLFYVIFRFKPESILDNAILFLFANLALTTFMLAIMETYEVSQRYYTVIFYWIGLSLLYFYKNFIKENARVICCVIFAGVLILYSVVNLCVTYIPLVHGAINFTEEGEQYGIINWMRDEGYYYGYAGYLDANCMTMLANGEVQISAIEEETLDIYYFVTDRRWYTPLLPEKMETVYIFRKSDLNRIGISAADKETVTVLDHFETLNYVVYVLDKNISSGQ